MQYVNLGRTGLDDTARGVSSAQVARARLLARPGVTAPIVGASKMYQLEEAVAAIKARLSEEDAARPEEPSTPHPALSAGGFGSMLQPQAA